MPVFDTESIRKKISEIHCDDAEQLSVIFSNEERILVEAPAGFGKTMTLIGKLAYIISTNQVPFPKKILALTFSVNAALKMKREIAGKLPEIIGLTNNPRYVSSKVTVSNYHGFCKYILGKFGYLVDPHLSELDQYLAIDDREFLNLKTIPLNADDRRIIQKLKYSLENCQKVEYSLITQYNTLVINKLISNEIYTHNSLLTISIQLLKEFDEIRKFLQHYYPMIMIDEFQDTNILFIRLINLLIGPKTKLLFVGDQLQKIYSFIGAIPNILDASKNHYDMSKIRLMTNYRFDGNPEMLKLDQSLRRNAEKAFSPNEIEEAILPYHFSTTQYDEADWIALKIIEILQLEPDSRIAVLVKSRGMNTEIIEDSLKNNGIDYFYGLFSDIDKEYIEFHTDCLFHFTLQYGEGDSITNQQLITFVKEIEIQYSQSGSKMARSLVQLLYAFIEKIRVDYKGISPSDKKSLIEDVLANGQLKQSMEYVSSSVILTTIHSAKGLEWDYVFLADVEKSSIPFYTACNCCQNKYNQDMIKSGMCHLPQNLSEECEKVLSDEFCVFYVALTRARKQVFISSSQQSFNYRREEENNSILSCFATLSGIQLVPI